VTRRSCGGSETQTWVLTGGPNVVHVLPGSRPNLVEVSRRLMPSVGTTSIAIGKPGSRSLAGWLPENGDQTVSVPLPGEKRAPSENSLQRHGALHVIGPEIALAAVLELKMVPDPLPGKSGTFLLRGCRRINAQVRSRNARIPRIFTSLKWPPVIPPTG
jgi:hypothetical protein